jgi:hypothetical protein
MTDVETFRDPSKVGKALKNKIVFNGIPYETKIFLAPIIEGTPEFTAVVNKFADRKQFDKTIGKFVTCLGTTAGVVKTQLKSVYTSAYVFVNEPKKATSDQASGSLQVFNWHSDASTPTQAWICDLCRNAPNPLKKSASSPVKPIMHLFEQLSHYLFGKTEIYLMVEKTKENDLRPLYEKYGYVVDPTFSIRDDNEHIVMKKTIVADPVYALFPFAPKAQSASKTAKSSAKPSKRRKRTSKRSSSSPKATSVAASE